MASRGRNFIQLPSDPDLLLQCIDGAESDDSDSDFDGYIDEEEALTVQSCQKPTFFPKGSSFLPPPTPTGKMIVHTYKM